MERPLSGFVVPPHEPRSCAVTRQVIAHTARQQHFEERDERPQRDGSIIGLRLQYSDWRDENRSSRDDLNSPPLPAACHGVVHPTHRPQCLKTRTVSSLSC